MIPRWGTGALAPGSQSLLFSWTEEVRSNSQHKAICKRKHEVSSTYLGLCNTPQNQKEGLRRRHLCDVIHHGGNSTGIDNELGQVRSVA